LNRIPLRRRLEQAEQRSLARQQWLSAKIPTVELDQVEGKQNGIRLDSKALLKPIEDRSAFVVHDRDLAVDHARLAA
jgi:hypothetical protein